MAFGDLPKRTRRKRFAAFPVARQQVSHASIIRRPSLSVVRSRATMPQVPQKLQWVVAIPISLNMVNLQ